MFLGRRFFIIFFIDHCSCPVVQNNARDYTFGALFGSTWVTFWHHLGDFGRHFGTSWAPRGSQNRPFWHQVAPKSQKKKYREKGERETRFFHLFGVVWRILGAIWGPAGRQGVPKIDLFGTKSHQNLKKWVPEWGIKKCMKIWSNFDRKNEDFECAQPTEILCMKAFWWLTHIMTKSKN